VGLQNTEPATDSMPLNTLN